jgi:hypothetical protein
MQGRVLAAVATTHGNWGKDLSNYHWTWRMETEKTSSLLLAMKGFVF